MELQDLFSRIKDKSNYIIDIGSSYGVDTDPIYNFITDKNLTGLCIEGDTMKAYQSTNVIASTFTIINGYITPDNAIEIFTQMNVPISPDILKIDIDGYDLSLIRTILTKYKPKIIIAEINEKIPPPVEFEVLYNVNYKWDASHFYGFSIASGERVMTKYGLKILGIYDLNNILCINHELCDAIGTPYETNVHAIYEKDYITNDMRKSSLSWNENVNHWLEIKDVNLLIKEITSYFETNNDRSNLEVKTKVKNIDFVISN